MTITKDIEDEVCNYYLSKPMTINNLSQRFNISAPIIIKILDRNNIKRYTKAKIYNPNMDEKYFENIDTQKKAYFLGLIITDGNVFKCNDGSNRQSSVSITLQDCDSYLLEQFKEEVHADISIGHDGRGASTVAVRSNIMSKDLENYGVTERKSFNTVLPEVSPQYISHLIRGIFDGDGCVQAKQTNVRNRYKHSVGFCGTKTLMNQIRDLLVSILNIKNVSVYSYSTRRLSMVTWGSVDDILKLYNFFYDDADIYMMRKKEKFDDIMTHYNLR